MVTDGKCRVVLTGCSGGGKSTLLAALKARGFVVFEESGRRIIAEEIANGGDAVPWSDEAAFARRCLVVAARDHGEAPDGISFYDRSLFEPMSWFAASEHSIPPGWDDALSRFRYHADVPVAPPWSEIFATDDDRRHSLKQATKEYTRLLTFLPEHGYQPHILPKTTVADRVGFAERLLGLR